MAGETPRDMAEAWAREMARAERTVFGPGDLPVPRAVAYLQRKKVLTKFLDGAAWVMHTPENAESSALARRCYWRLVDCLIARYAPAAIDRGSAIRLALGEDTPPSLLYLRHGQTSAERRYELAPGLAIQVTPLPVGIEPGKVGLGSDPSPAMRGLEVAPTGVPLPTMPPAWVLLAMPLGELREEWRRVAAWLTTLAVPAPQLDIVYEALGRTRVASRLAHVAADLGNLGLAERLRAVVHDHGEEIDSRARARALVVPAILQARPDGLPAYLARFQTQLDTIREDLVAATLPASPALPLAVRRSFAQAAKRDDIYHSTTIEGYRVTPEDMEAVLSGRPVRGTTPEEAERRLALLGYANAFDRVLAHFPDAPAPFRLTLDAVFDLHEALWYPSVDAGILEAQALRDVRNGSVFLRESLFVPPAAMKVRPMLQTLGDYLSSTPMSGAVRAGLLHWGFESIHPFQDGNGRIGRLLMNQALGAEGYPWVTIRALERPVYFQALEQAQAQENGRPWALFLRDLVEAAIKRALAHEATG